MCLVGHDLDVDWVSRTTIALIKRTKSVVGLR